MRILFCKISAMKFYKGVIPGKDEAFNGGSFVKEHGVGNEQYNFAPVISVFKKHTQNSSLHPQAPFCPFTCSKICGIHQCSGGKKL